ncbi:hypothetical protein HYS54_00225 [Candidatus Micrarchaeota archaeon]|nr:hypothetical protein [Candidatus Micrarchaeota archaeon]
MGDAAPAIAFKQLVAQFPTAAVEEILKDSRLVIIADLNYREKTIEELARETNLALPTIRANTSHLQGKGIIIKTDKGLKIRENQFTRMLLYFLQQYSNKLANNKIDCIRGAAILRGGMFEFWFSVPTGTVLSNEFKKTSLTALNVNGIQVLTPRDYYYYNALSDIELTPGLVLAHIIATLDTSADSLRFALLWIKKQNISKPDALAAFKSYGLDAKIVEDAYNYLATGEQPGHPFPELDDLRELLDQYGVTWKVKEFNQNHFIDVLRQVDSLLKTKTKIYIIGGGAMCLQKLKYSTKDLDIIVENGAAAKMIVNALKKLDFAEKAKVRLEPPYQKMNPRLVLEDRDGFRIDLFVDVVCNAFHLSEAMKKRAQEYKEPPASTFSKLKILLLAREDIFLLKSITERERDLDDMILLLQNTKDFNIGIVGNELAKQLTHIEKTRNEYGIAQLLYDRLKEIEKMGIAMPIIRHLKEQAERSLMFWFVKQQIEKGKTTFQDMAAQFPYRESTVRKGLQELERQNRIVSSRKGKKKEYRIASR